MNKIYIVITEEYGERYIKAVFSTMAKAKEFVDAHSGYFDINKFDIDLPVERKSIIWTTKVHFKSGKVEDVFSNFYDEDEDSEAVYASDADDTYLYFTFKTDSRKKAKEIALERFAQVKTLMETKFPLLLERCIANDEGEWTYYPTYDYQTGTIRLGEGERLAPGFEAPTKKIE